MKPQLPEAIGKTMNDEELEALIRATGTEGYPSDVLRLVEAVRSAERERCAQIADGEWVRDPQVSASDAIRRSDT